MPMCVAALVVLPLALRMPPQALRISRATPLQMRLAPVDPVLIDVVNTADDVKTVVLNRLEAAAEAAIAERGHFTLAIPGGSVMKMLEGTSPLWSDKCTLAYVNHKAVPNDDAALATHAKASSIFLAEGWAGCRVLTLGGSSDATDEARAYEAQLKALPDELLPRNEKGLPVFDLMLLGVGDDGHVGSLYPGRDEVLDASGAWVLPVEAKTPGSITMSLPVMAAAKEAIVAACGVSEKAPKGKGAAMLRAIEGEDETPSKFPCVGLRVHASWIFDAAAGGELSFDYAECFRYGGASQKANAFISHDRL